MNALISGQTGVAFLVEGDRTEVLRLDAAEPTPCAPADIVRILADANDVVEVVEISLDEVRQVMRIAWIKDRALHMVLILLDRDSDQDAKDLSTTCLNNFLENPTIDIELENRFFAAPLPSVSDLPGAVSLADRIGAERVRKLLNRIGSHQMAISSVRCGWDLLDEDLFIGSGSKEFVTFELITRGVFRQVVLAGADAEGILSRIPGLPDRVPGRDYDHIFAAWLEKLSAIRDEQLETCSVIADLTSRISLLARVQGAPEEVCDEIVATVVRLACHEIRANRFPNGPLSNWLAFRLYSYMKGMNPESLQELRHRSTSQLRFKSYPMSIGSSRVDEVLESLPSDLREIFLSAEVEMLSPERIATELGLPVSTVVRKLNDARHQFRLLVCGDSTAPGGIGIVEEAVDKCMTSIRREYS